MKKFSIKEKIYFSILIIFISCIVWIFFLYHQKCKEYYGKQIIHILKIENYPFELNVDVESLSDYSFSNCKTYLMQDNMNKNYAIRFYEEHDEILISIYRMEFGGFILFKACYEITNKKHHEQILQYVRILENSKE